MQQPGRPLGEEVGVRGVAATQLAGPGMELAKCRTQGAGHSKGCEKPAEGPNVSLQDQEDFLEEGIRRERGGI